MPDLTAKILPRLQDTKIPGIDLPAELIHPQYDGFSILNTPNSICKLQGRRQRMGFPR